MSSSAKRDRSESAWLDLVEQQVESLQFGIVQIVVHEARVVQLERTEKIRLDKGAGQNAATPTRVEG